jgi:CRISPR-associated protein Csm2
MADISTIMTNDPTGAEMVTFARQTAKTLVGNKLTRSQIRGIFSEVRKIDTMWEGDTPRQTEAMRRLNLLKPKLDYQAARHEEVKVLRDVLIAAIDEVNKAPDTGERSTRFHRFMDLFEAILAYHRAEGGRPN